MSAGTATINYAVTNTCGTTTVSTPVTVNTVPDVEPISGNTIVCTGNTTQLASITGGGVWSSNNEEVATVDANGLVTAVSAGTATINMQ
ncbi:MAG: Ig-like domain-containing protein [Bacteroidota bacterium]